MYCDPGPCSSMEALSAVLIYRIINHYIESYKRKRKTFSDEVLVEGVVTEYTVSEHPLAAMPKTML